MPQSQSQVKPLSISLLRTDGGTQARASIDEEIVASYARDMEGGADFPSVVAFFDGLNYWLSDGFQRLEAHKKLGRATISCLVHQGTQSDAKWHALRANRTHGAPLNASDKRNAIRMALEHPNGRQQSDRFISELIGVDRRTVADERKRLASLVQIPQSTERVGRDGRTINTANIGKPKRSLPKEPKPGNVASARWLIRPDEEEDEDNLGCAFLHCTVEHGGRRWYRMFVQKPDPEHPEGSLVFCDRGWLERCQIDGKKKIGTHAGWPYFEPEFRWLLEEALEGRGVPSDVQWTEHEDTDFLHEYWEWLALDDPTVPNPLYANDLAAQPA